MCRRRPPRPRLPESGIRKTRVQAFRDSSSAPERDLPGTRTGWLIWVNASGSRSATAVRLVYHRPMPNPSLPVRCRNELRLVMDRLIDWRWRIDTHTGSSTLSDRVGKFADAAQNLPVSYYLLFGLVGRTVFKPDDVFYDIGCGAGRVLCYVARRRISKVVGIELSPAFADEARKNAATLRGRISPIEVRCGDAAEMDYSD